MLNLAKRVNHWVWDPNEERKRLERWQQEQERLLQVLWSSGVYVHGSATALQKQATHSHWMRVYKCTSYLCVACVLLYVLCLTRTVFLIRKNTRENKRS